LLGEDRGDIKELAFDHVIIPDVLDTGGEGFSSEDVDTVGLSFFLMGLLDIQEGVLSIKSRVLSKGAGNDKEGFGEALDTELGLSRNFLLGVLHEVLPGSDLERTSSGKDASVLNSVRNSAESVSDSILGLGDGVIVGSLDEDGAGEGVLNTVDESVFIVSEGLLVNLLGETHVFEVKVIDRVELVTTTGEGDSLSVSLLGSADADDSVTGEELKRRGVNTLLVDDDEVLSVLLGADLSLEINNLLDLVVSESSLGGNQFLTVFGVGPEEAGVDFGLLVLERDVEAHDVAVFETGGHVGVTTTVVEDESLDESGLSGHLVLHVHELNHVEVEAVVTLNALDGIHDDFSQWHCELGVDLGLEGGVADFDEELSGDLLLDLEGLEELKALGLSELDSVNKDSGVDSFSEVAFSLSHEFSSEEDVGGGSISSDIILSSGGATDHRSSGVLDLHLVEEDSSILGQFNLSSTANKHLDGTLRSKVGLEDFLESLGGVDVDSEGSSLTDLIGFGVNKLKSRHILFKVFF